MQNVSSVSTWCSGYNCLLRFTIFKAFFMQNVFSFSALILRLAPEILRQFAHLHEFFLIESRSRIVPCAVQVYMKSVLHIVLRGIIGIVLQWCHSHRESSEVSSLVNTPSLKILLAFIYSLKYIKFYKALYDYVAYDFSTF